MISFIFQNDPFASIYSIVGERKKSNSRFLQIVFEHGVTTYIRNFR